MEVLQKARSKNQLCCIYTRHICGLKSIIVGNVQMFDRYMNVVSFAIYVKIKIKC